jgi:hypothetical protein
MRIRLLAVFLTVIFLPLSCGLAQTTASLDSIPARMHDVIVANEVPGAVTVVATRDSVLGLYAPVGQTQNTNLSCAWIQSSGSHRCPSRLLLQRC